jgi:hypothetical protein
VRARAVAPLAACLTLVAACSPGVDGAASERTQTLQESVAVELLQYRRDVADRVLEVKVTNAGDAELKVAALEVVADGFTGSGRESHESTIAAGRRVDLRTPYGKPECGTAENPAPSPAPSSVRVRLWPAGSDAPIEPELTAGAELLGRIHARECADQYAREAIDVAWAPTWQRVGSGPTLVVDGVLRVGPARRAAEVVSVEGTTLFATQTEALPAGVEPGSPPSDVRVRFSPQRCDPHAVGESKRGYAFGVRVRVEGQDEVVLTVQPDDAGHRVLEDALLEACGLS